MIEKLTVWIKDKQSSITVPIDVANDPAEELNVVWKRMVENGYVVIKSTTGATIAVNGDEVSAMFIGDVKQHY